ncbi:MAG: sulfur carrier protein ThiS adenylyltransferase ThiF [Candidatus Ancillula sp.]|nr:sulfur carrier protein ThiS adenylyltransferase ThiF [Candidatus Ancillula sp.]
MEVIERYARNLQGSYEPLRRARVAICGCGGLGSNIATALARIGVGYLKLIDFDAVEPSNLNRQNFFESHLGQDKPLALQEMLHNVNSEVQVEVEVVKIVQENAPALLQDVDIICEAFDNPKSKAVLANICRTDPVLSSKPYVGGSGMAGVLSGNTIRTRRLAKNFYICGDLEFSGADAGGLMAPRVLICAGHQANMITRLILGKDEVDDE